MLPKPRISLGDHQVGNMKGVGRIYRQTFLDTYSKVKIVTSWSTLMPQLPHRLVN